MAVKLKIRAGTAASWTAANPTLLLGEPGYETDTGELKIGDGVTPWSALGYWLPSHAHDASDITDGVLSTERIQDGSIDASKIELADSYQWHGPHRFLAHVSIEGVATFETPSVKLATNLTVTTDNGSAWWFNLASGVKTAGVLIFPANPSVTLSANDGAGSVTTLGVGSSGINFQHVSSDWKINGVAGKLNEVPVMQGAGTPPKFVHLCPPIRYEFTDFNSPNATSVQDPYFGTAIVSGTQSATPPAAFRIDGALGMSLLRSSTSANSGFRWMTQNTDRIKGQPDLYFRAILGVADDMNLKTIDFGFIDTTSQAESVDGAYFRLSPGSLVCTPRTSNNSARSSGSTFTLAANTYYVFEIYWESAASIAFTIRSLDEATLHLATTITTNIPNSDVRLFGAGIVATSSGTVVDDLCVIDYMGHGFKNRR